MVMKKECKQMCRYSTKNLRCGGTQSGDSIGVGVAIAIAVDSRGYENGRCPLTVR